jgi:translocation and assembly module TamB
VPVRLENGRVYHEGLSLTANGFSVRTTGSVGLDSTLDLVAEVPVPDSAVGSLLKNYPRVKEAVEKHRFKVPMWGTISKPRLDERAFRDAVRRYLDDVAKDAAKGKLNDLIQKEPGKVEKEVEKQLDKLFPPKK